MPYWLDGNNIIGQPAERARRDHLTRHGFLSFLSACSKSRGGSFLVFFDGDDPDRSLPPAGVRVRYSAPLSTDEAIVQRLAGIRVPSEVIVVTNDRSLARRCRAAGAKTMTWQEFTGKVRPDPSAGAPDGPEKRIDVRDWARYFGLDEDSLG